MSTETEHCVTADTGPAALPPECPAVEVESERSVTQPPQQHFYHRLLILLRLLGTER